MRLRLIALVLLVIAAIAAGFVLTQVDSSRDVWLVVGTGLALAAVTGVLALTRDRQRQAMPEVERYFTLAPEMVILAGFDGYWKRVNPAVEAILGYTEREWLARPFMEFIHPDDRERSEEETRRVIAGATVRAFENRVLCKDGSHKWIEWTATPVPEERVIYAVGRDVTDRRRSESEQAALQRIATLVAQEVPQADVFDAIAEEIAGLLGTEEIRMLRFDSDTSAVVLGGSGRRGAFPLGSHQHLEGDSVASRVLRTGRPARIDAYRAPAGPLAETARSIGVRADVGVPVLVEGRLWGAITTGSTHDKPLPPDTEGRLDKFTKLMATAVAKAEARAEVHRLAAEQAALRRVATLVAEGASPSVVLDAVVAEMEELLGAEQVLLNRFEPGDEVVMLAHRGLDVERTPVGTRLSIEEESVTALVRRTGRPARIGDYQRARGPIADLARDVGWNVGSAVGAPIVVDGRLWGVIVANWGDDESPPGDAEERMAKFAQLLDTAIANADSRDQLMASRARLLTAGDEARRRVVRDLHDGAQQRLVHAIVTLKLAQRAARDNEGEVESLLGEALEHAEHGNRELRDLAHGILPPALTRGGLRAGVDAFVARLDLPVAIDVPAERLPAELEASAYFLVAEGLTNVIKHAHATRAEVKAAVDDGLLQVEIRDDGSGGADPSGHGLVGMADRVSALGGRLSVQSPAGGGTVVTATLPLPAA